MGMIHICGIQHKITRATIVIYSERKPPTCPDHLVLTDPFRTPDHSVYRKQSIHTSRQQNVWISPAMGIQNFNFYYNARIYMYWWVGRWTNPHGQDDQACKELPPPPPD